MSKGCSVRAIRRLLPVGATVCLGIAAVQADEGHGGIWKAVVPAAAMHGEFNNNDPVGLTSGVRIDADCSINWVDPDTRKLYCFSSATSLVYFLEAPHEYLRQAHAAWLQLKPATP